MAYSISNEYKSDEISMARYAKALGHPARIAILRYLASLDTNVVDKANGLILKDL